MPNAPRHQNCRPGDIILFYGLNGVAVGEKIAKTLKILTVVPAIVSAVQIGTAGIAGSASCNHAAIISRIARNNLGSASAFDMSHATGAEGIITENIDNFFLNSGGEAKIFRCRYGGAGDDAATVARQWAPSGFDVQSRRMSFSAGKAFLSALRSSRYGSGAKARAANYRRHRARQGGPPDLGNGVADMTMFCSMFVIACYQAALGDDAVTGQVLALDSQCTSPMTLDGYLCGHSNMWEQINAIPAP